MAYSVLAVGLLTGVYSPDKPPPENRLWGAKWRHRFEGWLDGRPGIILSALKDIASDLGKTPAQVALSWVLSRPEISVATVGCDEPDQIDENLGALNCHLSQDQLGYLDQL